MAEITVSAAQHGGGVQIEIWKNIPGETRISPAAGEDSKSGSPDGDSGPRNFPGDRFRGCGHQHQKKSLVYLDSLNSYGKS